MHVLTLKYLLTVVSEYSIFVVKKICQGIYIFLYICIAEPYIPTGKGGLMNLECQFLFLLNSCEGLELKIYIVVDSGIWAIYTMYHHILFSC